MKPPKKSKVISSPEQADQDVSITIKEGRVLLTLSLRPRVVARLNKALANENTLCQFGVSKATANGLFTVFLVNGLEKHEAGFKFRKAHLEARPLDTSSAPSRLPRRISHLEKEIAYSKGWIATLTKLIASLSAGDSKPIVHWAKEGISENEMKLKARMAQLKEVQEAYKTVLAEDTA